MIESKEQENTLPRGRQDNVLFIMQSCDQSSSKVRGGQTPQVLFYPSSYIDIQLLFLQVQIIFGAAQKCFFFFQKPIKTSLK